MQEKFIQIKLNVSADLEKVTSMKEIGDLKAKYLGKYKILIPLLTDIAVPVSMTFRMFGSILSGFLMMALINNVLAPLTPVLPAFASLLFTCFHALIQSYVFAVLSLSIVAEAIE